MVVNVFIESFRLKKTHRKTCCLQVMQMLLSGATQRKIMPYSILRRVVLASVDQRQSSHSNIKYFGYYVTSLKYETTVL